MVWANEYIHTDEAADLLYAKDQEIAKVQAERDELKLKVHELSTEVERLSRELAR